ncbi:antitoxin VbhA family protein [Kineosporia sp. NBRC 101731]|uniref:antitoxin VbhA family protein n=1 Tax=Kineosporia sp. NBRC 101731 TaxID=3032199 RepID=UPI0024A59894|nr:hypothetical protein Kisp02_67280 [Kineosporia sp. NBRC 101731]
MATPTVRTGSGTRVTTRAERQRRVSALIHSGVMEGGHLGSSDRADGQEYVEGRITSWELRERIQARHGANRPT